jgi:hypothetical protein
VTRTALWAGPLALLGLAYVWLAFDAGTVRLAGVIVHEGGRHTLAGTIWYPRHFLREIPVALFYVAAARVALGGAGASLGATPRSLAAAGAALLVAVSWMDAAGDHGSRVALGDLLQHYVRDDEGRRGAHWGGHYFSNLAWLGAAWAAAAFWRPARTSPRAVLGLAAAGIATIVAVQLPAAAVFSPRAAAHQVRELATHAVLTLPLAFWALGAGSRAGLRAGLSHFRWTDPGLLASLAIGGALAAIALAGGALAQTPAPWSARVAAHGFEHALDYGFVVLVGLALRPSRPGV